MPKALILATILLAAASAQAQDQTPAPLRPLPTRVGTATPAKADPVRTPAVAGPATNSLAAPPLTISMTRSDPSGDGPYLRVLAATVSKPIQNTIADLRPLLKVETKTTRMRGFVTRRVCDLASIQIKRLLGDPFLSEDFAPESCVGEFGLSKENLELRDAEWKVWDNKIEELEKRLDRLGYP